MPNFSQLPGEFGVLLIRSISGFKPLRVKDVVSVQAPFLRHEIGRGIAVGNTQFTKVRDDGLCVLET